MEVMNKDSPDESLLSPLKERRLVASCNVQIFVLTTNNFFYVSLGLGHSVNTPAFVEIIVNKRTKKMSNHQKNSKKPAPVIEKDLMVFPPAIPFHPKPKKKADNEKEDETKNVTFKVILNRGEDEEEVEKTEWSFRVFEDGGDAEDYVKWRIRFEELAEAMELDTPEKKHKVLQQALRGEARARFNYGWNSVDIPKEATEKRAQALAEKRLNRGYTALAKQLFVPVDSAWRRQRSYLRYHVKFGNMTVAEFRRRLMEQNEFLSYFPSPLGQVRFKTHGGRACRNRRQSQTR